METYLVVKGVISETQGEGNFRKDCDQEERT